MQLLKVKIFFLVVFVVDNIQTELSPDGRNVCMITETYEDKIWVKNRVPKVIKKKKWCWSFSKRFSCDYSVVNMVDVTEARPITRTRIVPKCCDGYTERGEIVKLCYPVCRKRCHYGRCTAPEVCACFSGYHGSNCDKVCPDGVWGENCLHACDCSNNGKCDKSSGICYCEHGWTGNRCELPCQDGYYGYKCNNKCECDNFSCNHKTGECFTTTKLITTETSPEPNESSELLTKTVEEYTTEDLTENSTPEENVVDVSTLPTFTTENAVFSQMTNSNENSEETELISDATLITETITDEMNNSNETEKLIYGEKRGFLDSSETSTNSIDDYYTSINSAINGKTRVNFTGSEQVTDNFINEEKSSHQFKIFYFLPALLVFSSVSFLTFIIAAIWLINKYRNNTKKKLILVKKKDEILQLEDDIKYPTENFFWSNSCTNNPIFLTDVDLNRTPPVLKTFKCSTNVETLVKKNNNCDS